MAAELVVGGKDVEEEGFDVVVERLVVEEELGEKTQVLAVDLVGVAVHFKDGQVVASVNLVGRRVKQSALRL